MPDAGAPFGFDLSTTLVGSGLTLIVSSGILQYGDRIAEYSQEEMYLYSGGALLVLGILYGLILVVRGDR